VRRVAGVSFNDVALAVVAGALRTYLIERDRLPSAPLVSNVLVGLDRPSGVTRTWGNLISGFPTSLATDVADPWVRLRTVNEVTAEAKRLFFALGADLLLEALECYPPWIAEPSVRLRHRRLKNGSVRADHNVIVSSMMGPDAPWSLGFASVEEFYLSGPPNSGVGSIVGIFSYCDKAMVTVHSFAAALEDPREFARLLEASLADLVGAADVASGGGREATDAPAVGGPSPLGSVRADPGRTGDPPVSP
jgi:diacylglycerol O-acyltransferase / wax synthase